MKEYLSKVIVNETLLNNLIPVSVVKTLKFKDKEKKSDINPGEETEITCKY